MPIPILVDTLFVVALINHCISFVVMREMRLEAALTFDHHFTQAGFQALMRDVPQA